MTANYYTLVHIATELEHEFAGRKVSELFTQHRRELVISCAETPSVIIVGCEPANNFIYARKNFARARRNSANLFPDIHDTAIEKLFLHPTDRQLHILLNDTRQLVVQLFGSKANILLLDANKKMIGSFLKKTDTKVTEIELLQTDSVIAAPEIFISSYAHQTLAIALKRMLPHFGSVLIKELLTRAGLNGEQPINTFLENGIARLLDDAKGMKEELLAAPSPRIYFDGPSPVRFSIIPLHHLRDFTYQNYNSVSEAIHTYRTALYHEKSILQEEETIIRYWNKSVNALSAHFTKLWRKPRSQTVQNSTNFLANF